MGRRSHARSLSLWINGHRAGVWVIPARGEAELHYDADWVHSAQGRPLSLSLPFNLDNLPLRGAHVRHYFDNLLPDSDAIRRRVAERFRVGSTEPFDLLRAVGRDCVGAVQLLGEDDEPTDYDQVTGEPVSDEAIERHLQNTVAAPRFGADAEPAEDFRLSLAGAQEKTALLRWQGRWLMPRGATPTTHILKMPIGLVGGRRADFSTSVDNEWLCMRLLRAYGLPVAHVDIATFGAQRVLVVERFDRRLAPDGRWLLRLPQEDFCQAMGLPPYLKYEAEGGPGLKALVDTLRQSVSAEADLHTLMSAQVLFWLLRAPDGHAKNFSVHILPRGRLQMTPLYDVMSAWPVMGDGDNQWSPRAVRLAMAVSGRNRHYLMHAIQRRHFNATARALGVAADVEPIIKALIERTPGAIAEVRQALPPGINPRVVETVLQGLQTSVAQMAAMSAR